MRHAFLAALFSLVLTAAASAQTIAPSPGATVIPNDGATLFQVTEGVFVIEELQTVDLTPDNVLFNFAVQRDNDGRVVCGVNGEYDTCFQGARIDFKMGRDANGNRISRFDEERFAAYDRCHLDVVAINVPTGAPATGSFRLICL